ncbi:MAG TPA: FG-GAP-like repeat-containing protein, partial [Candidatus Thermoplasmatota archaeon]|nr:FG-GAP-like repeat-containing protein [Candidatus Thermoplasmatota archaeon]
ADYDGDGCFDLFTANFGPSYLYRGLCDGTFVNATAALGPVGQEGACGDFTCFSTSSGWADYDRDGDVDLYVGNYVESSLTDNERGPLGKIGQFNFLLRNDGAAGFSEVAQLVGAAGYHEDVNGSKSLGVAWFDYDRDGWPDIYVANDEAPNNLFHNNGDGTFTELAPAALVADPRASMGITAGDYDNDGWPDLFMTHYNTEQNGFYRNLHDGTFEDRSGEDGLAVGSAYVGWGVRFVDYDRDGWLDIVLANGHTEWFVANYAQPLHTFRNAAEASPAGPGDRRWVDTSNDTGLGFPGPKQTHRGLGFADFDLDGDVDMVSVPNGNETARLYAGRGVANHWLYLQLRQPTGNRDALGAVVTVTAGGLTQVRENFPGQSYLSQNSLLLEVGLGAATSADVSIAWPGGAITTLPDVPVDRVVRVVQGVAGFVTDTLAPRTSASLSGMQDGAWWSGVVEAQVEAVDRAVGPASGLVATEVAVDAGPWTPFEAQPIVFDTEGDHVLRLRSADAAGNREPPRVVRIPIDDTPPLPTHAVAGIAGAEGWYLSEATVSLGSEDAVSGSGPIRYRLDGGDWVPYEAPFVLGDGVHAVEFVAADVAGNEAPLAAFEVRVDTVAPEVSLTSPAPGAVYVASAEVLRLPVRLAVALTAGAPFPLRAEASDVGSGILVVRFALDGATVGVDTAAPYEAVWDTSESAEGIHLLEAFATDGAGNARRSAVPVLLGSAAQGSLDRTLAEGPALHAGDLLALGVPPLAVVVAPLLAGRRLRR